MTPPKKAPDRIISGDIHTAFGQRLSVVALEHETEIRICEKKIAEHRASLKSVHELLQGLMNLPPVEATKPALVPDAPSEEGPKPELVTDGAPAIAPDDAIVSGATEDSDSG